MRERGQNGNQLPAPSGSFWGGEFSTGELGNFQPALTNGTRKTAIKDRVVASAVNPLASTSNRDPAGGVCRSIVVAPLSTANEWVLPHRRHRATSVDGFTSSSGIFTRHDGQWISIWLHFIRAPHRALSSQAPATESLCALVSRQEKARMIASAEVENRSFHERT